MLNASAKTSFGTGIPLSDALRMILPDGWRVYAQQGMSGSVPVTWKNTDAPWTEALKKVLRQSGLVGVLHVEQQALMLNVRPVPKVAPLPLTGYVQWGSSHAEDHDTSATTTVTPLPVAAQNHTVAPIHFQPVFLLSKGDLILTDLQKWAKQSGWSVIWNIPEDWQVPNTTSFSGDFQQAVGQVIQALSANGANIHAVFHTANNTVVISGAGGGE